MSSVKRQSVIVLRWLLFAPAAIAAAALSRLFLIVVNRWTLERQFGADSFLSSAWITFISTVVYTAVLVYVSAYVAPMGKKAVSVIVATLATTVAVGLFALSLVAKEYETTFYSICFAVGACCTSWSIVHGDIEMPEELSWYSDENEAGEPSLWDMDEETVDIEDDDLSKPRQRVGERS